MNFRPARMPLAARLLIPAIAILAVPAAQAVPSFARQTGMACEACHTVWPELTHFGRIFKANGYTLDNLKQVRGVTAQREEILSLASLPPLSVMVQVAYTQLATPLPDANDPTATQQNGTAAFPQQISLFYAGKIAPHGGAFIQLTYENAAGTLGIDNADIRFAGLKVLPGDKSLIYGVTLNNNPTVQDLWNSTPAFGFPYAASNSAPGAPFGTQIDGELGQDVAGLSVYALWNESLYGELGVYRTARQGVDGALDSSSGGGVVAGVAPYWRFAYEHNWGRHSLEAGMYGLTVKKYPDGQVLNGLSDKFQNVAEDLQYQYMGDQHLFSIEATRIHENQTLDATYAAGGSSNLTNDLTTTRAYATYYWKRRWGGTVGVFSTSGSIDPTIMQPEGGDQFVGPDTKGWTAEFNYVPWLNTKLSVQYTAYSKFGGASSNYNYNGRNASDNNTVYILGWLAY